jgi:hypothetical protein
MAGIVFVVASADGNASIRLPHSKTHRRRRKR